MQYRFNYDANGNATTSTILNDSYSESIIPGAVYYIRAKCSAKYLKVYNAGTADGTDVKQFVMDRSTAQQWKIESTGDGYYRMVPQHAVGKSLYVSGNIESAQMEISTTNNSDNQKFKLIPTGEGTYQILTKISGDSKSVYISGSSTAENVSALQHAFYNYSGQRFIFEPATKVTSSTNWDTASQNSKYYIRARHSGKYIDVYNAGTTDGTKTIQCYFHGGGNQQFKLIDYVNGYYKIEPVYPGGKVLQVEAGTSKLSLYTKKTINDDDQYFKFEKTGTNSSYKIISKQDSMLSAEIAGGSEADFADVLLTTSAPAAYKEFIIEKVSDKIITSANYTTNGNYMSSMKDARGNDSYFNYNETKGTLSNVRTPGETTDTQTNYVYDPNTDVLKSVSKPNGAQTITNSYDYVNDKLDTITHNGFMYDFGYDLFGNTTTVAVGTTGNMTTLVTNTFKPNNGLLDYITYGNSNGTNNKVAYVYNTDDMIESVKYDGVEKFKYIYDNTGNLYQKTDNINSQTTNYFYDFIKRPIRTKNSNGLSLLYNYDSKNRLSSYTSQLEGTNIKTGYVYGDATTTDQKPGLIYGVKLNDVQKLTYSYDSLTRLQQKTTNTSPTVTFSTNYSYLAGAAENTTTTMLESLTNTINGTSLSTSYTYDVKGNITSITEGTALKAEYFYDNLNQLIRENNVYINKTIVYSYDIGGNITSRTEYTYTTQADLSGVTPTATIAYAYTDTNWKDKLTSLNGDSLTYDAIGNPLTIGSNWSFSWQNGRRLASTTKNGVTSNFKYDDNGIRTQKTVDGVVTDYYINSDRVEVEKTGTDTLQYFYDEKGDLFALNYNGVGYFYVRNGQNDITGIVDTAGIQVVSYVYDSWGKLISTTGTLASTVGVKNPYRYRGYRYDVDTGLYYVGSRYYDPNLGRFLNSDDPGILDGGNDHLLENNLFAYCFNNPVNMSDEDGLWPTWAKIAVGVGIIAGLAILTVCTGGAAGVIAGAALSGAIAGGGSGAAIGAISGALSGGSWKGALDGAADGFMKGTIIGGATGALSAGANIASGGAQILGKAHGTALHKLSSNMQAGKMASQIGRYSKIGLNKSLKSMGLKGKLRPDVTGIARFGKNKLIEVVSLKQSILSVTSKMSGMLAQNSGSTGRVVNWVRYFGSIY